MGDMNKRRGKILGMEPMADGGQKLLLLRRLNCLTMQLV